jgi:hypothetical protein
MKKKKLFSMFTANTQKKITELAERHTIRIASMKQTTMKTQNLLDTETMPKQPLNGHRSSVYFTAMTKSSDVL